MELTLSSLPARIQRLHELAYNLWWSWHKEAEALFSAIDPTLWVITRHNPVKLLREVKPERLTFLAQDPAFLRRYDAVMVAFDADLTTRDTWISRTAVPLNSTTVAYFSAEFGIHNSLPIYGGGLGILAGIIAKKLATSACRLSGSVSCTH